MDSLTFDWGQENCWLVPPVYLVPRVLLHFLLLSISRQQGGEDFKWNDPLQ